MQTEFNCFSLFVYERSKSCARDRCCTVIVDWKPSRTWRLIPASVKLDFSHCFIAHLFVFSGTSLSPVANLEFGHIFAEENMGFVDG